MRRREFLGHAAAASLLAQTNWSELLAEHEHPAHHEHCHPTYATPQDAMRSPPEKFAFVPAITVGTKSPHPDYLATVDVDPQSPTYSQVVGRARSM